MLGFKLNDLEWVANQQSANIGDIFEAAMKPLGYSTSDILQAYIAYYEDKVVHECVQQYCDEYIGQIRALVQRRG